MADEKKRLEHLFQKCVDKMKKDPTGINCFIRHKNGNTLDNRITNLEQVGLVDSMCHINTWKVDWVLYLSKKEVTELKHLALKHIVQK